MELASQSQHYQIVELTDLGIPVTPLQFLKSSDNIVSGVKKQKPSHSDERTTAQIYEALSQRMGLKPQHDQDVTGIGKYNGKELVVRLFPRIDVLDDTAIKGVAIYFTEDPSTIYTIGVGLQIRRIDERTGEFKIINNLSGKAAKDLTRNLSSKL